jgi:fumarate hydratase class I
MVPAGMLSLGIGGSPEKAMLIAKWGMMEPMNMHELKARGPRNRAEELRLEIHEKVNALGIGAQGLGGLSTVLDVKVNDYPTHAASKPVALLPNCAATRHAHFVLDGSGPREARRALAGRLAQARLRHLEEPAREPRLARQGCDRDLEGGRDAAPLGKLLTGRDAAHKRMVDMIAKGEKLPVDLANRFIYYTGPVDAVREEVVGPAGPTTSSRMDKFVDTVCAKTGLIGMVGKSERGPAAIEAIRKHGAVYCIAVGGAAYLVSKAIKASRVLAFEDLGMEAIREFEVRDMPVTVAVDSTGSAVHKTGPAEWRARIGKIPVAVV